MSTYTDLQTSIQQDLRNRTDLNAIVLVEVPHRVSYFQTYPFTPQEATDTSITTVIGTSIYTLPATIVDITGVWFNYSGSQWLPLQQRPIEFVNTVDSIVPPTQSLPGIYAIYQEQIRLYPTPNTANTLKINCTAKVAAPVAGADSNFWTNDAFDLIRHAVVEVMAKSYLHDYDLAQQAAADKEYELSNLLTRAAMLRTMGQIRPRWY
jgi:hypothetical protein